MKLYPPIFLVLIVVMAGIGLFSWSSYHDKQRALAAQQWVMHSHNTINHLDEVWILMHRKESAMRGFGITKNKSFATEYHTTEKTINDHLRVLDTILSDNPSQLNNLNRLKEAVKDKKNFESKIQRAAIISHDSASAVIGSMNGKKLMDKMSVLLGEMKTTEKVLLQQRAEYNKRAANTSFKTVWIGALVASLFTIAVLLRLNRDILLRRKTEKELTESETKYREFIENAKVVSFTCDKQGFFTFISNQVGELTGYNVNELTGKHFTELIAPSHLEQVAMHYAKQGNELIHSTTLAFPIMHKNGGIRWVEQDTIILIKNDIHIGFQSVVKDITEKMHMNERLNELKRDKRQYQQRVQAILDNTPLAIYVKDMEGKYILVNKKFRESFEVTDEEIIGKSITTLNRQTKEQKYLDADRQVMETGKAVELEDVIHLADGEHHILTIKFPLYDENNKMFGISGFMKDITEMVRYREELINARQRAETAEVLQEQFLANMSHEIRTPMNGIIGMTNLLQKTTLQQQQHEYVQIIKQSSDNLLVLINDILDLSKIKAGKISIEKIPFNIGDSLKALTATFKIKAEEKNIRFSLLVHPTVPAAIKGDPHRLSQILNNLLSNAMKFTEQGYVALEVGVKEINGKNATLCFQVVDTGIGIEEKSINYIFESFAQASSSTTRKYGGTGLGLAITKRLIEMQDGEISISSKPGEGSTFTINIPYEISSLEEVKESIMPASKTRIEGFDLSNKTILIVEDNEINRIVLQSNLKQYNLKIAMAENGYEAIQYLKSNRADLILMDLHMPEMDGFEATENIRDVLKLDTPIVVLSASALKNERQRSIELGANDYLTKPFSPEDLQGCLEKYLMNNDMPVKPILEATPSETKPVFDLSMLIEMGDKEVIAMLHKMFEELVPVSLDELKENAIRQDWDKVRFISHKLKSSLGVIRIHEILENMSQVEILAKERRELDTILSKVDQSINMYNEVMPSVRVAIEKQIA